MRRAAPHIICGGLIALDLELSVSSYPVAGAKHKAQASRLVGGGGALNAAAAIARLGGQVTLYGAIGDDELAPVMRARIQALGVPLDQVHGVAGAVTPHSAVLIEGDGDRTIINWRDDQLAANLPPLAQPFGYDGALVDTRFPQITKTLLAAARAAGKPAVIDAEAPVRLVQDALCHASHIAFSVQGLTDYTGRADAAALAQVARQFNVWVCVTRGPDPVLCHDGNAAYEIPVPVAVAQNTNGAGDTWHGAFTLALAAGQDEMGAVRAANSAAARHVAGQTDSLAPLGA
ncbi:PfkB family carbohydrate kinase [Roseinatronobacter sp. NSM]|uniref:PfkB family carbohydrate kinase n=1 Tax=Roseinatronobacter sp. NSM TaxID=3457785 RepID=UPI00403602D4